VSNVVSLSNVRGRRETLRYPRLRRLWIIFQDSDRRSILGDLARGAEPGSFGQHELLGAKGQLWMLKEEGEVLFGAELRAEIEQCLASVEHALACDRGPLGR
jgi:hypothetical protein